MSDGGGLEVLNASLEIAEKGVQIKCDWFGSKDRAKLEAEKYIIAAGIIPMIYPLSGPVPEIEIMKFQTEAVPIAAGEKFSTEFIYLGGDFNKFSDYQMKRAFAVLITLDENLNPVDISETIASDLLDNLGGSKTEGVVCSGKVENETPGKICLE
jgi:hypothetical protein